MAHRRGAFRSRGVSDSQRRKKTWVALRFLVADQIPGLSTSFSFRATPQGVNGTSARNGFIAAGGSGIPSDPFVSTLPDECTILRIRGSLTFPATKFDSAALALDTAFSFGMGVAALQDNIADNYPAPITDPNWSGWMFMRQSTQIPVDAVGTFVDVKAMRKMKTDEVFFMMGESLKGNSATPAISGDWLMDLRLLILLP